MAFTVGLFLALAACGGGGNTGSGGGSATTGTGSGGGASACGNGMVDPGEECDGSVAGKTCADVDPKKETGTLACSAMCTFDASGCTHTPVPTDGTLTNGPACAGTHFKFVPTAGKKAVVASVFTPDSYPFVAKKVRYTLGNGFVQLNPTTVACGSEYAHAIHVFVVTDPVFPAGQFAPPGAFQVPVPFGMGGMSPLEITVPLPQELTLTEGQHLVVGVQIESYDAGGGIAGICLQSCNDGTTMPLNYESSKVTSPYVFTLDTSERFDIKIDGTFMK